MENKANIAIIILAAGNSSRMGQQKQLLPWKNSTLLNHSVLQALSSEAKEVFVVLGAHYKEIEGSIKNQAISILHNPNWEKGMGRSIAIGIKNMALKNFSGALIMLADQPQVNTEFLNKQIHVFQNGEKPIIATSYKNGAGVPAIFDKTYFKELTSLTGQKGAKDLIKKNSENVKTILPSNPLFDIDTEEMYLEAKSILLNL